MAISAELPGMIRTAASELVQAARTYGAGPQIQSADHLTAARNALDGAITVFSRELPGAINRHPKSVLQDTRTSVDLVIEPVRGGAMFFVSPTPQWTAAANRLEDIATSLDNWIARTG